MVLMSNKQFDYRVVKGLMVFAGYMLSMGFVVSLFIIFIHAYLDPTKRVVVDINSLGEADLELFLFFLVLYFIVMGLVFSIGFLFQKKKRNVWSDKSLVRFAKQHGLRVGYVKIQDK